MTQEWKQFAKQPWHTEGYVLLSHAWSHLIMQHGTIENDAINILIDAARAVRREHGN